MKRLFIILISVFCLCGCTNINKASINTIVDKTTNSKVSLSNQYRTGYKYYLPANLNVKKSERFNDILTNGKENYYLYVDVVNYYYQKDMNFSVNENAYYSQLINNNDCKGSIEINVKSEKYLIEIIYNYAKIEVIVEKDRINEAVTNSLMMLSSINYNKSIIKSLMEENILNYGEEKFNLFETNTKDSNFLEYVQEYDVYEEEIPDYDLIN